MADVISFRASYETEAHWRTLPNVKSALSVAEAKVLIARELGLEREFARTFDLELYVLEPAAAADASADRSRLLSDDDNNLILLGSRLIVNRVLWGQVPNVVHSSSKAVGAWVKGEETKQQRDEELPDGLKCARCRNLARNPLLARCTRGCTKSVCKSCAELLVARGIPAECPVCNQRSVASFVPNRTLAMLVARIDAPSNTASAGGNGTAASSGAVAGGDNTGELLKSNRRNNIEDPNDMWLLFVDPSQMAIVHRDGFVVLPWLPQDPFCQKTKDPITLCVLATGGGGTSIVSPGTCRIQRLWYCKSSSTSGQAEEEAATAPAGNTPNLQPLVDLWYKDCSEEYRRRFSNGDGYIIMELQWLSRYPTPVLLPGKAQPIAGILASAPKDAYVIDLTNAQKQGVTQRLYSEAHFARCSGSAPAPVGLGTILARLNRSASAANEEKAREAIERIWNVYKARNIWTGTHWNRMLRMNPLIPWTATIPKLTETQFNTIRFLQQLALHSMDPKNPKPPPIPKLTDERPKLADEDHPPPPDPKKETAEASLLNEPSRGDEPVLRGQEHTSTQPPSQDTRRPNEDFDNRWRGRRPKETGNNRNQQRNMSRHPRPRQLSHDERKPIEHEPYQMRESAFETNNLEPIEQNRSRPPSDHKVHTQALPPPPPSVTQIDNRPGVDRQSTLRGLGGQGGDRIRSSQLEGSRGLNNNCSDLNGRFSPPRDQSIRRDEFRENDTERYDRRENGRRPQDWAVRERRPYERLEDSEVARRSEQRPAVETSGSSSRQRDSSRWSNHPSQDFRQGDHNRPTRQNNKVGEPPFAGIDNDRPRRDVLPGVERRNLQPPRGGFNEEDEKPSRDDSRTNKKSYTITGGEYSAEARAGSRSNRREPLRRQMESNGGAASRETSGFHHAAEGGRGRNRGGGRGEVDEFASPPASQRNRDIEHPPRRRRFMEDRPLRQSASPGGQQDLSGERAHPASLGADYKERATADKFARDEVRRPSDRRRVVLTDTNNNNSSSAENEAASRPKLKRPRNTLFSL